MLTATVVIALDTIAYVGVAWLQLKVYQEQLEVSRQELGTAVEKVRPYLNFTDI